MPSNVDVGLVYLVITFALCPPYILAMIAMYRDKELFTYSCYKLMFVLGIHEIVALITQGLLHAIFDFALSTFDFTFEKLNEALNLAAWNGAYVTAVILAINRCLHILRPQLGEALFTTKALRYWIAGLISHDLAVFIIWSVPGMGFIYVPGNYTIDYAADIPAFWKTGQMVFNLCSACLIIFFYAIMVLKLEQMRKEIFSRGANAQRASFAPPFLTGIVIVVMNMHYYVIMRNIELCTGWCVPLQQYIAVACAGINCMFYFVFNKGIRSQMYELLGCQKHSPIVNVMPASTAISEKKTTEM